MNDKKLKRLFDFQKFEGNSAMNFAIQSARSYIASLQNSTSENAFELNEDELDMVNAAGVVDSALPRTGMISPAPHDKDIL
ncbi:MAG: hypothetical protein SPL22_02720 [Treponema sp.]|jgi:hypothetical protein|uniref:hypothetical protein n=1 Tax=Treponema sp. TaxID=166 RepID=UPI002A91FE8A|nr:hypothetical protein [Treponema sp.]MDY6396618.1 hypothetical protein [Treponema sp.]